MLASLFVLATSRVTDRLPVGLLDTELLSDALTDIGDSGVPGRNLEPIYDTIDLDATYDNIVKIFERMNLSPDEMAALIGGGHASGKNSLNGGEYYGQWVPPEFEIGSQYWRFLSQASRGEGWCAVKAQGSAYFVAGGPELSTAAEFYSAIGRTSCGGSAVAAGRSVYNAVPDVTVDAVRSVMGEAVFGGPAGATAMVPADFMLQYKPATRVFVNAWAADEDLFFVAFETAWHKLTTNGVKNLCPEIGVSPLISAFTAVPKHCTTKFYLSHKNYQQDWANVATEVRDFLEGADSTCKSKSSVYCMPSLFRLGWHVSGTWDPNPVEGSETYGGGVTAGSEGPCFQGQCKDDDGCGGCLSGTVDALNELTQKLSSAFPNIVVSLPDVIILAASISGEILSGDKLSLAFQPGRKLISLDHVANKETACSQIGARLPAPAYVSPSGEANLRRTDEETKKSGCPFAAMTKQLFSAPH